ncbi:MAG TPA: proton-conducting transporter membrane subunit [Myxococcota bacterium]|nr:proton-conducting transporter membrane subunit [Myxococcota bacterium]
MALWLVLAPLGFAAFAFAIPGARVRPWLLPAAGATQLVLVALELGTRGSGAGEPWIGLDPIGRLVTAYLAVLFFLCAAYAPGYLALRAERPNRIFCSVMLVFFAMMNLIASAQHLGLMWVAVEATTLASGPLLYFNRNPRSIEATWKYLLIGSVGIALALLGTFFVAYAALRGGIASSMLLSDVFASAPRLSRPWLHSGFVLALVGYGTKMGLAPMHTWKPDAYGEAPGLVGALLAGGLTSCAFVAILRFFQICAAAADSEFARSLLLFLGLFSMAVAGAFMVRQSDYKRMLAYSSVEHMGILVLGIAIGGAGSFGALLHLLNNGFSKGVLFLSAGNIHRAFGSKRTSEVSGALSVLPASGALFLAGFFAITGTPPFGTFVSEFTILSAMLHAERWGVAAAFLFLLVLVFVGMGSTVLAVVQGEPSARSGTTPYRDSWLGVTPIAVLLGLVLVLGLWIPAPFVALLREAAATLEAPR